MEVGMAGPSQAVVGGVRGIRGWAIFAGLLLIIGGVVALMAPFITALVATLWVAWGLIFGGVAELVSAYSSAENRLWKVLLGVLYFAVGVYMLVYPGPGLAALALTLAWLFLLQGIISIVGSLSLRPLAGWAWWLFDGIVTVLLALLIFSGWPHDSVVIISVLVGISLIISGANRLALAAAL
jgi:uncharacterized membrane protein HdeD (DUF308 family)